ncbi:Bug family tripartite tricarboxylate transporter substrate binding protein [Noviherbaspirillum sedimenti]|nr:tripartite tricarboxylate transporter substrate binding protein [Noviherbaspirillum sedimenti]
MTTFNITRRMLMGANALLVAAAAALLPAGASAQATWPGRPIKLIDAFPPGGSSDVIARAISNKLSARLGQPVVVENKSGAGGALGTDAVAKATPDGYTLLVVTTAMATNASTGKKLPFNFAKDLVPIGQIATSPLVIVVPAQSQAKTLRELVDLARAKPNGISYGSSGVGSMSHIGMEMLAMETKAQLLHVPYKGIPLAYPDLVSGRLQAMLGSVVTLSPLLESGKLRLLAVAGPQRMTSAPNLPTTAEAGFPGFQIEFWWGLMGPAGMPPEVVRRINEELNTILAEPDMREMLTRLAAIPKSGTPDDFGRLISLELSRWSKLIKEANIKVE